MQWCVCINVCMTLEKVLPFCFGGAQGDHPIFLFKKTSVSKLFFFLHLSSTFSRLKKMLCLTSTAIMLLLLSFNIFS